MIRLLLALVVLIGTIACGSGSDSTADGGLPLDATTAGDVPLDHGTSRQLCRSNAECDDGVPCTEDVCQETPAGGRECRHIPRPGMCRAGETCNPRMGCEAGGRCTSDEECRRQINSQCLVSLHCDSTAHVCVPERMGCDDGLACTVDYCIEDFESNGVFHPGGCRHTLTPARCGAGETCHETRGCIMGQACAADGDCVDMDPCTVDGRCDVASRVCVYRLLDGDGDGDPSRTCGGADCNDADRAVNSRARELCNGADDNCDGRVDEGPTECGRGTICRNGGCECTVTPPEGLMPGRVQLCTPRAGRSMTICTDVRSDREACGRMCVQCPSNASCLNGVCTCTQGNTILCGDVCADTGSDRMNCAGCGLACPSESSGCVESRCACPSGLRACLHQSGSQRSWRCTDVRSDADHCGDCGLRCMNSDGCRDGLCLCRAGESSCVVRVPDPLGEGGMRAIGFICANLQTSNSHCGMCGNACPMGESCQRGFCLPR